MTFRGKLLYIIILPIVAYLLAILLFSWEHYLQRQKEFDREVNAKLVKSCRMADSLYLADYHNILENDTANRESSDSINKKLSFLSRLLDVHYIYSFIYKDDSVFFSSSSYTDDDSVKGIVSHCGDYYQEATPALKKLFKKPDTLFENSKDEWGAFKSGIIAKKSPGGKIYLVGTDIDISRIKEAQRANLRNAFIILLFLIIIFVPFAYFLFKIVYREKKILDQVILDRTSNLQEALVSNQSLARQVSIQNRFITNILNSFQELILVINKDKKIERVYGSEERMGEWASNIEIGKSVREVFPPSIADNIYQEILDWNAESARFFEICGEDKWYSIEFLPLVDEELRLVILKASDITEKKIEALKIAQFQQVVESSASSIVITQADATIEYVNPAFERLTGYSRAEVIGKNPRILQSGYIAESYYDELWAELKSGKTWKGEFLNRKKNGELFWERAVISPIFNDKNEIIQYVAVKDDITNQLEVQKENEQTKTLLQTILENSKDALVLVSESFQIQYFNYNFAHFAEKFYGKKVVLHSFLGELHEDYNKIKERFIEEIKSGKREFSEIFRPGFPRYENYYNVEVRIVNAGFGRRMFVVEFRDISKSYVAEVLLKQSEQKFRQLFDAGSLPIAVFDRTTGRVVDVNHTAERFYGIEKKEVVGKPFQAVNYFKDKKIALYISSELDKNGKVENLEAQLDDTFYPGGWVVINAFEGEIMDKKLSYLIATDITHVKQVEKAIKIKAGFEELVNVFTAELLVESDSDFDVRLKLLLEKICNYLNVERGYIHFFNQGEYDLTDFYQWTSDEIVNGSNHLKVDNLKDFPYWFSKLSLGETIITNDIELLTNEAQYEKDYFRSMGIRKIIGVPIMKENSVIGFIGLDSVNTSPWIPGIVKMLRIIGELFVNARMFAEYREKLKAAVTKADEATQQKSLFLARMSHELRTPLNGILASIELMKGTRLSAEAQDYAEIIQSAGEILLTVISDILDYSKIEARQIQLEDLPFKMRDEMNALVRLFESKAREKNLKIHFNFDDSLCETYNGDVVRIKQIIGNILSNAVKFTDSGSVELSIRETAGLVEFKITDTGIGIPGEIREKLFHSYVQAGTDIYRKYGGTGLGLSIASLLTNMMNGSIMITDNPFAHGTCFIVSLPLERGKEQSCTSDDSRSDHGGFDFSGIKILLAEDNFTNQKIARIVFQKQGVEITIVSDGLEAVEKLKKEFFDVILMDIQMPVMDGMEATRLINEYYADKASKPIIIAMTADSSGSKDEHFQDFGFSDYIPKPFKIQDIIDCFRRCFKPR